MQGASRESLRALREQLPASGDLAGLSAELYSVVSLLTNQASLRRALSDPSALAASKLRVADSLFASRVGAPTMVVIREGVRSRWAQPRDLLDSLEELAVDAALGAAEEAGELDEVEDELFRFSRILEAEPTLREALTNRSMPTETKSGLLHTLLDGKVSVTTFALLQRAVNEPRGRTLEHALRDLSALAAQRRNRLIAHVTTAVPLTAAEETALADALGKSFDSGLRLQVVVDPSLVGGLTVRIGDELIDASVARQLDDARRKLTGKSGSGSHRA